MGRWSWSRLKGKEGNVLQVVSAYRPCVSYGPLLTYQQQVQYLARNNSTASPKELFLSDLAKAILEWQAEGAIVIVTTDMNEDVRNKKYRTCFEWWI